jgi:2-C-methyl-D-erythritol 4-phosphate cytidylyltransferase
MKKIAIIPAGGAGLRFGSVIPKQFLEVKGKPLIVRTIEAFEKHDEIDEIHIPAHKDYIEYLKGLVEEYGLKKTASIIEGGNSRQDSVYNAIIGIDAANDDIILIHDAARPFAGRKLISETIREAIANGAVIPYLTPSDTIKSLSGEYVKGTYDRSKLAGVQTPQAFKFSIIKAAFENAIANNIEATDDSSLVELTGIKVKAIKGERINIKITDPLDLKIAELFLEEFELAR